MNIIPYQDAIFKVKFNIVIQQARLTEFNIT